jgi:CheY-like chemotaxis protein/HPt (histidine-containing phosphotransfer) domain-containing protein
VLLAQRLPLAILLADDLEVNRRLVLLMLKRLGYEAQAVGTGREAVEAATRASFDLVLMDVQMPDMDGFAATRRIIELMGGHRPRIVAMTAHAMARDLDKCFAAGMDDYIPKPFTFEALQGVLERAGRAANADRPADAERAADAAAAAPAGETIDWTRIDSLRPYDSDGSMVREIVAAFLRDGPKYLAAIRAAQAAADAGELASAAHALKGAAANIGARMLEAVCREAESLARAGTLSGDFVEAAERRLDEAVCALAEFRS